MAVVHCVECGQPLDLPARRGRGRPRLYCSDRCRWRAAARARRAGRPAFLPGPPPSREEIAGQLAELLPGAERSRPEEELVSSVLEIKSVAVRLSVLAPRLPARLAGRAGLLAARIAEALEVSFPEAAR